MPLLRHRTRGVRFALYSCALFSWVLLFAWVLLFGAPPARADEPDGDLLFPFVGEDRIYALEGDQVCQDVMLDGQPAERCLDFDLLVDSRGRYEGEVTLSFEGAGFGGELMGELKGSQKRRKGRATKVDFRARRLRGDWTPGPLVDPVRAAAKLRCKGEISPTGVLDAVCEYVLKRPGGGTDQGEIALPGEVIGGNWDLEIKNLMTLANDRVEANANDSFGFIYDARGKYKESKDESKLKLKGPRGTRSRGAKVILKDLETPGGSEATALAKYKLLGARGKTPVFSEEDE